MRRGGELTEDGQLLGWQAAFCHDGARGNSDRCMADERRRKDLERREGAEGIDAWINPSADCVVRVLAAINAPAPQFFTMTA
jgi:hypothetical protein